MIKELAINNIFDNNRFRYKIIKESLLLLILYLLTLINVYILPSFSKYIIISFFLFSFLISKKNYFWLALFFALITKPGNFFAGPQTLNAAYRLPIFPIISGISLSTEDIILIFILIKAIIYGRRNYLIITKPYIYITIYGFFLVITGLLVFNASFSKLQLYYRMFFASSLIFTVPALLYKKEDLYTFARLIFPFVFIVLFTSLYFFIYESHFIEIWDKNSLRELAIQNGVARLGIFGGGHLLLLFSFIFSLEYANYFKFNNYYFLTIALSSYMSIFLTATRVWFVVFSIILIVFLILNRNSKKNIRFVFLIILGSFLIFYISNSVFIGFTNSWTRISSIFTIGDPESAATQMIEGKAEFKLPPVINGFIQSPIFGMGFTNYFIKYGTDDVGNFNLLLEGGIIGFILFMILWIRYIRFYLQKIKTSNKIDKKYLLISLTAFIGLLIAHFTTNQIFAFTRFPQDFFFLSLFFLFSEKFIFQKQNRHLLIKL